MAGHESADSPKPLFVTGDTYTYATLLQCMISCCGVADGSVHSTSDQLKSTGSCVGAGTAGVGGWVTPDKAMHSSEFP
jgi:hypothetical protein